MDLGHRPGVGQRCEQGKIRYARVFGFRGTQAQLEERGIDDKEWVASKNFIGTTHGYGVIKRVNGIYRNPVHKNQDQELWVPTSSMSF